MIYFSNNFFSNIRNIIIFSLFCVAFIGLFSTLAFAQVGEFLTLDGLTYKDVKDSNNLHPTTFTLAAWFKTNTDFTTPGHIIDKGGYGSEITGKNLNFGVWIRTDETLKFGFETSTGIDEMITSPNKYNDNLWHYVVGVFDDSTDSLKLYVDGNLISQKTTQNIPDTSGIQPVRIGANSLTQSNFFKGSVDEVRIWDRALSSQEVKDGFEQGIFNTNRQIVYLSFSSISTPPPSPPPPSDDESLCKKLNVVTTTATGYEATNPPSKAVDGNLDTRWSNFGLNSYIQFDLGVKKKLCNVDIAWYRGNERTMTFTLSSSSDGNSFTTVYSGKSSGSTVSFENYNFQNVEGRYLKITVTGNTMNEWASLSEVKINGMDLDGTSTSTQLQVIKNVYNGETGTKTASDFKIHVTGVDPSPSVFSGVSGPNGVLVNLSPGTYSITEDIVSDYTASYSADCSGTISSGQTKTCTISNTYKNVNPTPDNGLDKFGIKKIYPTKIGGEEWYMNMNNPSSDPRNDPKTSLKKNSDGSWKITSNKVRYNVFTSTGYDSGKIVIDQQKLASRGYMQSSNDWKNLEITGYVKVNEGSSNENFAWYAHGGRHTGDGYAEGCEGTSYKVDLFYNGKIRFAKEQWHVSYEFTPTKTGVGSIFDKWVGFKGIMYNIVKDGKTSVKLESWIDKNNNGQWVKLDEYEDKGGLGSQGGECKGKSDQIMHWGGPISTFRWDGASDVDIKNLSVREIQP